MAPYTPSEIRFHLIGAVLNGAVTLGGLVWLLRMGRTGALAWPWLVLAILAGFYAADLVSGLLHWAFDTWFDEDITFLRRMVLQVREHHVYPYRIFHISFTHDAGTLSWIALILTGPLILGAILTGAAEAFSTLELHMSYFRPVVEGRLAAHARVIRRGTTTAHLECDLEDGEGRLVARASSVCAIRQAKG